MKEKPYWYDRVHSDLLFPLSSPTIPFYILDVAAVREEPQVLLDRQATQLTNVGLIYQTNCSAY